MSTLHTVNKSPFERNAMTSCLSHVQPGDSILLIEDAVVAGVRNDLFASMIATFASECRVFALTEDTEARGLKLERFAENILLTDYNGFVDLVAQNDRVCSWL